MVRVTENSSTVSTTHRINKTKSDLENLQIKGASLKKINRPSDNPIGNNEIKTIESVMQRNDQYLKNINMATLLLDVTERSLEDLSEILNRGKDVALSLSSSTNSADVRLAASAEIKQLFDEAILIGNKMVNNRYIFAGFDTLKPPFDSTGIYRGDEGDVKFEVAKDYYVKVNFTGSEVFLGKNVEENVFYQLGKLYNATTHNDEEAIRDFIEDVDKIVGRTLKLRTNAGLIGKSVASIMNRIDNDNYDNIVRKGKIIDVDIVELFSDISKQEDILKNSYQTTKNVLGQNLLNFIR